MIVLRSGLDQFGTWHHMMKTLYTITEYAVYL